MEAPKAHAARFIAEEMIVPGRSRPLLSGSPAHVSVGSDGMSGVVVVADMVLRLMRLEVASRKVILGFSSCNRSNGLRHCLGQR